MSHVEFKKSPCRPVDFRGQRPSESEQEEKVRPGGMKMGGDGAQNTQSMMAGEHL